MTNASTRGPSSSARRVGATRARASSASARRLAAASLLQLSPLLEALGEAAELPSLAAARRLRRAVVVTLGWRARLVPSSAPLAADDHPRVEQGVAVIPVAPGAGALRLSGGGDEALRQVAELCAHALARARLRPLEPGRRAGHRQLLRVLVAGRRGEPLSALAGLLGPGAVAVPAEGTAAAAEAARVDRLDAAVLDLSADPDALRVLEALRSDVASAELPAIVIGRADAEPARLRALELGAEYLSAPCSAAELQARLELAVRQARSTRALRDEALTDSLTGLPNRRALESRLHEELRRARRYRTPLACLMADLDHLKPINDTLGHATGDQALQAMAAVLQGELRASDFAARAGGDEFLLLLPHTSAAEAQALAERVLRRLSGLRLGRGPAARTVSASFGVAELGPDGDGPAMVEAADQALYAAKRAGRATVRVAPAPPTP